VQTLSMDADEIQAYISQIFPQVAGYGFNVEELEFGRILVTMETGPDHLRPGGTVSGPTLFTMADCAAYLLVLAHIGKVSLAVTTSLNINFLDKPEPGILQAEATLLKLGKRLVVSGISIGTPARDGLFAHATATYSIPPKQ